MAHFNLENELSNALRLDVPLNEGPIPRWQRKQMEKSSADLSMNSSSNNSTLINVSMNKSGSKLTISPYKGK